MEQPFMFDEKTTLSAVNFLEKETGNRDENNIDLDVNSYPENKETESHNDEALSQTAQGSNEFGKFKDSVSLLNAYNNLQAEFTRKCQKISELERQQSENLNELKNANCEQKTAKISENIKEIEENTKISEENNNGLRDEKNPSETKNESENSPAEKANFERQVRKFFASCADAKKYSTRMSELLIENPELKKSSNAVELAYKLAKSEQLKTPEELVTDEEFLTKYVLSKKDVANKILGSLLGDVASAPKIIAGDYGSAFSVKSESPKNLLDAKEYILNKFNF